MIDKKYIDMEKKKKKKKKKKPQNKKFALFDYHLNFYFYYFHLPSSEHYICSHWGRVKSKSGKLHADINCWSECQAYFNKPCR